MAPCSDCQGSAEALSALESWRMPVVGSGPMRAGGQLGGVLAAAVPVSGPGATEEQAMQRLQRLPERSQW